MKKVNFIFLLIFILLISGCDKEKEENKSQKNNIEFYEVRSYLEKNNDWVYYMNISYDTSGEIIYYEFNGINRKIDKIENLYMPVRENGKIVDKMEPSCICLNYYQPYKKEYNDINNFFNVNKFQTEISIDSLETLKTNYYSKSDLVYLFNEAIKMNYKRQIGKFDYVLNSLSKEDENGLWTIVTDGSYGYLEIINIDYKLNNGIYVSELSENNFYKIMNNDIENIENYIIKYQQVNNIYDEIDLHNKQRYKVLFELISEIKNV